MNHIAAHQFNGVESHDNAIHEKHAMQPAMRPE